MIQRTLELKDSLDTYCLKLRVSKDNDNRETYDQDYLNLEEQDTLRLIKEQLEPLFLVTKGLEGNADLDDGENEASYRSLQEQLPVLEHLLAHFEDLEKQAKAGKFNHHKGIQSSITFAWTKTTAYYEKTDVSITQMAAVVLHPRFKQAYFEMKQKGL